MSDVEPERGQPTPVRVSRPRGLPAREAYIEQMLGGTKRAGVPLRSSFVQLSTPDAAGKRASVLAEIVRGRSDATLDAFLLIHALASSRAPYEAWYPVASWVRALGLDEGAGKGDDDGVEAAKTQWSKIATRLVNLGLIKRLRSSNRIGYALLDESGSRQEYIRPVNHQEHGHWFAIPHIYWLGDFYKTLDLPAKAMLLIALSSKARFELPAERVPDWYGLSVSTARRGFKTLQERGVLEYDQSWRVDAKSKTGWAEVRTYYLRGEWSLAARNAAMRSRTVQFDAAAEPSETAADGGVPDE